MSKSKHHISFSRDDHPMPDGDVLNDSSTTQSSRLASVPRKSLTDDPLVEEHNQAASVAAGRLPEEVYTNTLPRWRATLRRKCVSVVEWESEAIGKWQVRSSSPTPSLPPFLAMHWMHEDRSHRLFCFQSRIRSPWLDTYFLQSSTLGTHTFFLVFLPIIFFFGYDELGRGYDKTILFSTLPIGGPDPVCPLFFLSGFAMPWPLACILLHSSKIWCALRDPMPRR
jgi:hypothetical protein